MATLKCGLSLRSPGVVGQLSQQPGAPLRMGMKWAQQPNLSTKMETSSLPAYPNLFAEEIPVRTGGTG